MTKLKQRTRPQEKLLLSVQNLSVYFGDMCAARDVSFTLERGKTLAIVGESGSGKSVTALSLLKLLPYPLAHHGSKEPTIDFDGQNLATLDEKALEDIRGNRISMIFQEPMTSLNPLHTIGKQVMETLRRHKGLSKQEAFVQARNMLERVHLRDAASRMDAYPHELSGGERQRVMIAMALATEPDILIADEPTTALDVTTQQQILDLLRSLQTSLNMALILITHDLNLVRRLAQDVVVMCQGEVVEQGPVQEIFQNPKKPYTQKLMASIPSGKPMPVPADAPVVLTTEDVGMSFPIQEGFLRRIKGYIHVLMNVSFTLRQGETIGIVGESGSGKTTLALALTQMLPYSGRIVFLGESLESATKNRHFNRAQMQMVFQDPYSSLNPRLTVGQSVLEGLRVHRKLSDQEEQVALAKVMEAVHLPLDFQHRYPHELSGGQRQRVALARALILEPAVVILDEPTSALDMTIQLEIIELLRDLQKRHKLSYIFISHDLRVVRAMSHEVFVLQRGHVVEHGPVDTIYNDPKDAYTRSLMHAAYDIV